MNQLRMRERTMRNRRAFLRQTAVTETDLPLDREVGAALCRDAGGNVVLGPLAEGHVQGVSIDLICPAGTTIEGTWHTHPEAGGGRLEPVSYTHLTLPTILRV